MWNPPSLSIRGGVSNSRGVIGSMDGTLRPLNSFSSIFCAGSGISVVSSGDSFFSSSHTCSMLLRFWSLQKRATHAHLAQKKKENKPNKYVRTIVLRSYLDAEVGTCILNLIACTSVLAGMIGGGCSSSSSGSFGSFSKSSSFFLSKKKKKLHTDYETYLVQINNIRLSMIKLPYFFNDFINNWKVFFKIR